MSTITDSRSEPDSDGTAAFGSGRWDTSFSIPIWTSAVVLGANHVQSILDDLASLPFDHRDRDGPNHHVDSTLTALLGRPHWSAYRSAVITRADLVAETMSLTWSTRHVYFSALTYSTAEQYPGNVAHAHPSATFVAAMPLRLPAAVKGRRDGATLFRSPPAAAAESARREWSRPATELELTIFPGFLDHRPATPAESVDLQPSRVVLTADLCYFGASNHS